jgi:hypothetical protein
LWGFAGNAFLRQITTEGAALSKPREQHEDRDEAESGAATHGRL